MVKTDRRVVIAAIVFAVAAAAAYSWWSSSAQKSKLGIMVDDQALDIEVDGIQGTRFVLSDHRGKVVVLEFITTWCRFCKDQHEVLSQLREEVGGVFIASIDIDANLRSSELETWVESMGVDWFHGHSPEAGLTYQVSAVPTVIIIDKDGVIRYRGNFTPFNKLQLRTKQLL